VSVLVVHCPRGAHSQQGIPDRVEPICVALWSAGSTLSAMHTAHLMCCPQTLPPPPIPAMPPCSPRLQEPTMHCAHEGAL
jgi:hypothetical protein